ncbi:type IV secretory system conjugative DNA transfer family protein [Weissella paramesenteroides]|uniref:type IV secretory system conjugative DNA transfer family protein n=1 Tax=Weissella paramesenteroides TaxID=1249 RepID=UPI0013D9F44A|nr:type IV secretory system conjugative DNA transfer family protein [Weissella paramesenteroides]NEZ89041.1 type IV secretion system protein VirD4 [Weissella paramesenteroides]NFB03366.1 type IV secretion system protein VirD4 [Weissella paramesenteroides]
MSKKEWFGNRYEQARAYEKQSQIRLRGQLWFQLVVFVLYCLVGIVVAVLAGTLAGLLWYIIHSGLGNLAFNMFNVYFQPAFSWDYLQQYTMFTLTGGVLHENSYVIWIIMILFFAIFFRLGIKNWYDWTQKFGDRTTNQNRWASLREIDRTYVLIPDRNKFYKGTAGQPIIHISGYSYAFFQLHPVLWLKQIIKAPLGLNRETFPRYYQNLRQRLLNNSWIKEHWFKNQLTVEGGFNGFYWIDPKPTHAITTGATRSGKDQRRGYIFIDIMRRAEIQPNIIDTDAKNEDAKMSFIPLQKAGYEVQLLNIADTDWSESWNPFQVALNYAMDSELDKARDEAMVIVQIIGSSSSAEGGHDIWDKTAEDTQLAIILILIWLAMENQDQTLATPAGVPQFINSVNQFNDPKDKNLDGLTQYFNMLRKLDPIPPIINEAILKAGSYLGATGDTKSSVMFTLQSRSSLFASETVARLTSRSTIQIADYGFPRMLKVNVPTDYAGTTAKIELYKREDQAAKGHYLEQDAVKVSRSGVIQYPFQQIFPDEWQIKINFKDEGNPKHLQKSWIQISGEKRLQRTLNHQAKINPQSQQPVKKIVTYPLEQQLIHDGQATFSLRYSEAPKAVFIVTPQSNDNYAAIASLFLGQVFSVNTQIASEITRRKMDRQIIYKLNEFSMFPRIPGFDNFLTRGLTYGHIVDMYVQDDVQVAKHYSESEAKEIMNNMLTQFHIQTKDQDTNRAVSERLGEIEVQKEIVNSQMGEQQQDKGNRQVSIDKMPLLSPKELEELNDGEMVIMRTAKRNDKKWRRIRPLPIFDTGKTLMPNARDLIGKSYHLDYYTTDLRIKNNTKNLSYEDIFQDYSGFYQQLAAQVNPEPIETGTQMVNSLDNVVTTPTMEKSEPLISETGVDTGETIETQAPVVSETDEDELDDFEIWKRDFENDYATKPLLPVVETTNTNLANKIEDVIADLLNTRGNINDHPEKMNIYADAKEHMFFKRHAKELNKQKAMRELLDDDELMFDLLTRIDEVRES